MMPKRKYIITVGLLLLFFLGCGVYYVIRDIIHPDVDIDFVKYPVRGIDISSHNGEIDFDLVKRDSITFIYMKATEGASFKDNKFEENYNKAIEANLKVGAYHFFRFDVNGTLQAVNFINSIEGKALHLPLAIDVEEHGNPKAVTESVITRLQEMIDYIVSLNKYDLIIYTNNNGYRRFIQSSFADYPLWMCRFTAPRTDVDWQFWQYSHWGTVEGIDGSVDLNIFNGSTAEFNDWIK